MTQTSSTKRSVESHTATTCRAATNIYTRHLLCRDLQIYIFNLTIILHRFYQFNRLDICLGDLLLAGGMDLKINFVGLTMCSGIRLQRNSLLFSPAASRSKYRIIAPTKVPYRGISRSAVPKRVSLCTFLFLSVSLPCRTRR